MTDSLGYLLGRAAVVEQRVRELVAERRAADPAPDDPFRGLYLTDDAVDVLLHSGPAAVVGVNQDQLTELDVEAEQAEQSGADIRLRATSSRCRPDAAGRRTAHGRSTS